MGDAGRKTSYLWDEFKKTNFKPENKAEEPEKPQETNTITSVEESGEQLITTEIVKGKEDRSVKIKVYKVGETEEIQGEYIVKRSKLKFVLSYDKLEVECTDNCDEAVSVIAPATGYKVTKKLLSAKINELKNLHTKEERINIIDYVSNKYSYQFEKITKDPFKWVLEKTNYIIGYDRLKVLVFLSVVSSRLDRVAGMSRLHILLVGKSGAGKSTTVKSVLRFLDGFDLIIRGTRFTQNALGYLNIDTFDNKIVFLEQIDDQNINYLREMMTEEKVCTLVTEKVKDVEGSEKLESRMRCVPGQGAVISTSVIENIDVYREQLFNRFLKVYVDPYSVGMDRITEAIWERKKDDVSKSDALVFYAYLISRPKFVSVDRLKEKAMEFLSPLMGVSREPLTRVTEILRNLVASVASARGKTEADDEDFEFVIKNFQLDILYNGLGLTERDVEIINTIPDYDVLKTSEIAEMLKLSKSYASNLLKDLERKGVIESEIADGRTHLWSLTDLGRRIKQLLKEVDKKPLELVPAVNITENITENKGTEEKGIDGVPEPEVRTGRGVVEVRKGNEVVGLFDIKFRQGNDGGRHRGNAVSTNDGGGMFGDEKETEGITKIDPQFIDFVVGNNGMVLSFFDIYASFLNENKTKEFINWCVNNGYCEPVNESGKEKYLIRATGQLLEMKKVPETERSSGGDVDTGVKVFEKVEWKTDEEFTDFLKKCLHGAECYIDRTVEPPVIRFMGKDGIEVLGWVRFTRDGGLESHGLVVEKHNNVLASYKETFISHGTYYLIRENGEEKLVRERDLKDKLETVNIEDNNEKEEIKVEGVSGEELREIVKVIRSGNYEIDGYVVYIPPMDPKVYGVEGVTVEPGGQGFVYKGKRYPPGVYDRVISNGIEYLVPHDLLLEL
jgi:DNA-binding MarR family transcriptional regulator